ncbi:MAG: metallophosphoesterase [Eubacterium sp.]|nr:metallophosphoesterase [Eubacterium sp.]
MKKIRLQSTYLQTIFCAVSVAACLTAPMLCGTQAFACVNDSGIVSASDLNAMADTSTGTWHKNSRGWWYAYPDGSYAKSCWLQLKGVWYHFDAVGYMQTGWLKIGGKWYFLAANGAMQTGWREIQGKRYFFQADGVMAAKRWVGRHYLSASGAMTKSLEKTGYSIPSYFRTQLYDTAQELDKLQTDPWVSAVVITDTHGSRNSGNSASLVRYLLEHSSADRCLWLGDLSEPWFDDEGAQYQAYAKNLLPCADQVYVTIGNHDRQELGRYSRKKIEVIYKDFLEKKAAAGQLQGEPENFYYYMDDPARKLRWLVLNTSNISASQYHMSDVELTWIAEALCLPDTDWSVVIFGHEDIDVNANQPYTSKDGEQLAEMIAGCNGHVVGYICGHEHLDLQTFAQQGFYQTILTSDAIMPGQKDRKSGTAAEAAVTVVSINTATGEVRFQRIGASLGENVQGYNFRTIEDEE